MTTKKRFYIETRDHDGGWEERRLIDGHSRWIAEDPLDCWVDDSQVAVDHIEELCDILNAGHEVLEKVYCVDCGRTDNIIELAVEVKCWCGSENLVEATEAER